MKKLTCMLLLACTVLVPRLSAHGRPKCSECDKDRDNETAQVVVQNVAAILMNAITAVSNPQKPQVVAQGIGGVISGIANIVQQSMKDFDLKNVNPDDVAKIVAEKLIAMKVDARLGDWVKKRAAQQGFTRLATRK